ncbi:MAG: response regulator [Firmicutes bacterium]|nr:response regulator [Bacillota bacterium]
MYGTRIAIADDDAAFRKKLKETLVHAGYMVVAEAGHGRSLLKAVFQTEPDLVIMDAKLPGAEGLEIARIIEEHRVAPVILLTASHEKEVLEEAKASRVFAYLVKPLSEAHLLPAIEISIANFKQMLRLQEENKKLKQALESRKLVEKAKGLVMEARGWSEKEAYKYLQKLSMDNCVPIASVARQIIAHFSKNGR